MQTCNLRAILAISALTAAFSAQALTITQSFNYGDQTTSWTKSATFDKFDTTKGTLDSIDFYLDGGITTTIKMSNLSASSNTAFTGTVTGRFSIFLGNTFVTRTNTFLDGAAAVSKSGDYAVNTTGDVSYTNGRGEIFAPDSATKQISVNDATSSTLAMFSGLAGDQITLKIRTGSTDATDNNSGNAFIFSETSGYASGYLRYNYTPEAVPEPATMAALGLGALGVLRRRKGASK